MKTGYNLSIPVATSPKPENGGSSSSAPRQTEEDNALIRLFNQLQTEKALLAEARTQIAQGERLKLIGQFAGNLVHDINNVLQGLTAAIYLLRRQTPQGPQLNLIDQMERAVERGGTFSRQLLDLARDDGRVAERVDLAALMRADLELYALLAGGGITLTAECEEDLWPALAMPGVVQAVMLNLIANARDAQPEGGAIRLGLRNCHAHSRPYGLLPRDYVVITVADDGAGMAPDVLRRVGQAFFTTKAKGSGTGLGLAAAREFARAQGGDMFIESKVGEGTRVSLYIRRSPTIGDTAPLDGALHGGADILIVEDDEPLRQHIAAQLEALNYRVTQVNDGAVAQALLRRSDGIDIAILGLKIGQQSGVDVADELRAHLPDMPIVFLMGETAVKAPRDAVVLRRPLSEAMLAQTLLEKLGRAPPSVMSPEALGLSDRVRNKLRDPGARATFDIWKAAAHRTGRIPTVDLVVQMLPLVEADAALIWVAPGDKRDFEFVFAGDALARRLGRDLSSAHFAASDADPLGSMGRVYERCARGIACFDYARVRLDGGKILLFERLCLPLSTEGSSADHIFAVVRFEELAPASTEEALDVAIA